MNVALRGLTVLVGGTAVVMALSTPALATPAGSASTSVRTVHSCSQNVAPGHYTCYAERRSDLGFKTKAQVRATALAAPSGYGPSSLQSAYNLPSSSAGSGQTVYIVDAYNDPNAESDLSVYRSQFGMPACTTANGCFKKLNQNGQTSPLPANDTGWSGEISLDLDMVSAVCPNCKITLIEASDASDNLFTAVNTAANLGAKFVSLSWGGPETGSDSSYDSQYFRSSGVVYTASTGDGGYQDGVIYPATSVDTVAVGGTHLTAASNSRGWNETVWKTSNTEGTGSGCSSDEAKPSWQNIISTTVCSKRADSDVSAVADPATGVAVYQTYGGSGWAVYGGTSASAPIVASVYALAGTPASSDHPASFPYAHAGNVWDVTSGNNGTCTPALLCTAAAGWDGPTGLGTPNGTAAFAPGGGGGGGNTVAVTSPGSQTGTVGGAVSLQVHGSDSGGLALTWSATGLPTGLSINSSTGLVSGTLSAAGTFNATVTARDSTGASGNASFTWTISPSGAGCANPGQKLRNRGFESGNTVWSASSAAIGQWGSSGEPPHGGTWNAWLDGYGTTHTDTVSQSVTIPAGCSATLSFYLHVDTSEGTTTTAYDKLTVKLGTTTLKTYSNLNHAVGYSRRSFNVSSFAGRTVTLKFTGTEDVSLQTSFVLDDTALTAS